MSGQVPIVSPLFMNCFESGLYDEVAADVVDTGTAALAGAEYNDSFYRVVEQWLNNYLYQNADGTEFRTNIVGEIGSEEVGTIIGAKGNHYAGRVGQAFRPITDESKIKNVLVLGMPTCCSPFLAVVYQNQIGTLNMIREADEEEERHLVVSYNVREWIKGAAVDASLPHDLIVLHTSPIYVNPNKSSSSPAVARISKKVVSDVIGGSTAMTGSVAGGSSKDKETNVDIKLGALYDPYKMKDYGGPYFNHQVSKLAQLDIVDDEDQLVPPWDMYDKLRPGMLILANCSLHCFLMSDGKMQRKLYQINVHSIKVIAHSDREIVLPIPPSLLFSTGSETFPVQTVTKVVGESTAQGIANQAFAKFSSSKKRHVSSADTVHVDEVPEKKWKVKGKQKSNVKLEEDSMQLL